MSEDPSHSPTILVSNRQEAPLDEGALVALARTCMIGEGVADAELSVSFVSDDEIAELHERYMGESGPTDVLSFRMDEDEGEDGTRVLGDVVIAPGVAARNNPDVEAELRLLLVHGILHLLGHDHEEQREKTRMWERQGLYVEVMPA